MARISVSLKDKLLAEIDRQAELARTNRSAVVQTALEEYLQAKRKKREEERNEMEEASRRMDALAKKLGDWHPQTTIRKFRDTNLKGDS